MNSSISSSPSPSPSKHPIQEDKADEVKALIARYVLLKIEQKKIESKLAELARYYDNDSLRMLFEPIGESMMGIVGLDLPRKKDMSTRGMAAQERSTLSSTTTSTTWR
jgi:hypothetical protein